MVADAKVEVAYGRQHDRRRPPAPPCATPSVGSGCASSVSPSGATAAAERVSRRATGRSEGADALAFLGFGLGTFVEERREVLRGGVERADRAAGAQFHDR